MIESVKRDYSLDLIRTMSMLGVVALHIFGAMESAVHSFQVDLSIRIMYTFLYCSVNLFALLSGYLYYNRETKIKSIVSIWTTTIFWGGVIGLLSFLIFNIRDFKIILTFCIPYLSGRLWYITDYSFCFFMIPFMNKLLDSLSKKEIYRFVVYSFIFLSVLSTFLIRDRLGIVGTGYSAVWLCFLYFMGGVVKKYGFGELTSRTSIILLLFNATIMVLSSYILQGLGFSEIYILYRYASPFIVFNSLLIFCLTLKYTRIESNRKRRILTWASSTSLGVYVIHANPFFLDYIIITDNFRFLNNLNNQLLVILGGIIIVCIVFFACGVLETLRKFLFKTVRMYKLEGVMADLIEKLIDSMVNKCMR